MTLAFAVALGGFGVGQPVVSLVIGVRLAPPPSAVADYLGVLVVTFDLPAMVGLTALSLTVGTTAHKLVGMKPGRLEELLAITTAAVVHRAAPKRDVCRPL